MESQQKVTGTSLKGLLLTKDEIIWTSNKLLLIKTQGNLQKSTGL